MARDRRVSLGGSLGTPGVTTMLLLPELTNTQEKVRHLSGRAEARGFTSRAMKKLERRKLGTTPMG